MSAKILCYGELLLRMTAPGRERLLQSGRLDVHVGGAEANVAVGLASLGHEVAMVSRVPANALGEAATGYLRRYQVDASAVAVGPGRMGLYFLSAGAGLRASEIVYDREGSSFAAQPAPDRGWAELLEGASLLHLSGITPALGAACAEAAIAAAAAARAAGVTVSFDGNYRAQLWQRSGQEPRPLLVRLVEQADIFFGNHRDTALLLDRAFEGEGEARRREAVDAAFAAFPNLGLIASTARHAETADLNRISARIDSREGGVQTEEVVVTGIVDRIGAGDAFAAGILHGLSSGLELADCAQAGLGLAALKHSLPGDASLFAPGDLQAFLSGETDVRR